MVGEELRVAVQLQFLERIFGDEHAISDTADIDDDKADIFFDDGSGEVADHDHQYNISKRLTFPSLQVVCGLDNRRE